MSDDKDSDKTFPHNGNGGGLPPTADKWKVIIVDDAAEIHAVTKVALKHFVYDGKPLEFISSYSGSDAKRLIAENPDTAVILLDDFMENEHSGLDVTKYIREELKNHIVRIILRTGNTGQTPKLNLIIEHDINDYIEKTALGDNRLSIAMILALRTFRDIITIENNKTNLEKAILEKTKTGSHLTTLLGSTSDMISIKDNNGKFVLVNDAYKKFIGLKEEEIIGSTCEKFLPPSFLKKELDSDFQVLETLKAVHIEQKLSTRKGNVYIETIKSPIFAKIDPSSGVSAPGVNGVSAPGVIEGLAPRVIGLVSVSRDITERKNLEIELRESRDEYRVGYRALVENSKDIITRIGSDYVCRYINSSCNLYMPLKPEDFIGKHVEQFHELGLEDDFIQDLMKLTESTFEFREKQEIELYLNDNYFQAVSVPERDTNNNVKSVVVIAHDISDRRKIENTMHKNLQLLTKAVETTQVGFTVTDKNGIIIYSNTSEAEMHGYMVSEADLLGFTVNELIGKDISILAPNELRKPLTQEELIALKRWKRESVNLRKDGSTFPVQLMSDVVMGDDGNVVAIVTSCEDIFQRKQMEKEIKRHNEHLEDLVQARTAELYKTLDELKKSQEQLIQSTKMASLGILTAGVAHEINNPLAFVYGNIGNMDKFMHKLFSLIEVYEKVEMSSDAKSEIENFKKEINYEYIVNRMESLIGKTKEGANRIKKIVLDLKNFARLDISDITDMDINESLDITLELLYHEYKNRVVISKEYGEIPAIHCYAAKINQVFMNLLINACQAIEGEGEVKIKTSVDDEMVNISITDNGKGIPPEVLDKIFDPFFTTKPVGVGTGLGLSISYKIIKEHGGEILVESSPGRGAEFKIKIPRHFDISG